MGKKELQRYSLRKSSLGAASVLLGTAVLAVGASNASADEVATSTDSVSFLHLSADAAILFVCHTAKTVSYKPCLEYHFFPLYTMYVPKKIPAV